MIPILSLLLVIVMSILVTRIATIALTYTGFSRESARFQARSAFTGTGFTTKEAEGVISHPVRRRIVLTLMLLGNAGIVTAVSSLILTFVGKESGAPLMNRILLLVGGVTVLWGLAMSSWVDRHLSNLISWALKRYTKLDVTDYASLMHLAGEYSIVELEVEPEDWLAEKTLQQTKLRDEGILVLGIKRPDGTYLGAPKGATKVSVEDVLILYGRAKTLEELDRRRKNKTGDRKHAKAVEEQKKIETEEEKQAAKKS